MIKSLRDFGNLELRSEAVETLPLSVIVLTKNEERDLGGCLESLKMSGDVHLFDSCSTDRTVEIAKAAGCIVTQRPFDNWSAHQNWGLANLPFKHPWVLYVDADERVTPDLWRSIERAIANPGEHVAFRIQRRDFLMGRWLKHAQATPKYIRLFRPEAISYERLVNPVTVPTGPVGDIPGYIDHFPFSKGVGHWIGRHNSYSQLEAEEIVNHQLEPRKFSVRKAFFEKDFNKRRFHQKELFQRLPARPLVKFMVLYFLKGGFLDGRAGWTYARLAAMYEYMIILKTAELRAKK